MTNKRITYRLRSSRYSRQAQWTCLATLCALGLAACASETTGDIDSDQLDPSPSESKAADGDPLRFLDYHHPLTGVAATYGPVLPIFDQKNSSSGARFAMGERLQVTEAGSIEREGGIVEFTRDRAPADALRRRAAPDAFSAMPDDVRNAAQKTPGGQLVLEVRLQKPDIPPLAHRLQESTARGLILSRDDRARLRSKLVNQRRIDVELAQDRVSAEVTRLGGQVLALCPASYCMTVSIPGSELEGLLEAAPSIVRVDLPTITVDEAVNGENMAAAIQVNQFYPTYQGWMVHATGIDVGQIEGGMANLSHVGFNVNSTSWSRILASYDCTTSSASSCTTDVSGATVSNHATGVAGLMIGNLTNAQDSTVTNAAERVRRSGYGRDAQLVTYAGKYAGAAAHLIGTLNGPPEIINMSAGINKSDGTPDDPTCSGTTSSAIAANDIYEDGIAFFKSAGNSGSASTTDCTVTSPGAAIGVMPVGNHGNSGNYTAAATGEAQIRTNGISGTSSRGGTATEGGGRTIVGLTAYGCRTNMFDTSGTYTYQDCGTSFASPTVVGAALDFMDHYMEEVSDFIDDPGVLYANILLMGDRQGASSVLTSGFDNLWGAGRLRARRRDNAGIDGPGAYGNYSICIDDGEEYYHEFNSGTALSSDVDMAKAVIWWYDSQHETGGGVDNIDLRLQTYNTSTSAWETKRSSTSTGDNRERVYVSGATIQSKRVRLRITGADVTNDNSGCGTNSMKVYLAYLWEDSDRDDSDGPAATVFPE